MPSFLASRQNFSLPSTGISFATEPSAKLWLSAAGALALEASSGGTLSLGVNGAYSLVVDSSGSYVPTAKDLRLYNTSTLTNERLRMYWSSNVAILEQVNGGGSTRSVRITNGSGNYAQLDTNGWWSAASWFTTPSGMLNSSDTRQGLVFGDATASVALVGNSQAIVKVNLSNQLGFYNATPVAKPTVTGSKGANAALGSLMTALSNLGLVTDSTT